MKVRPAPRPDAVAAALLGNAAPKAEGAATAGQMDRASRNDHTHPSISWRGIGTLDASGNATFDFRAKPFTAEPVPLIGNIRRADGRPVTLEVAKWLKESGGNLVDWTSGAPYAGAVVYGSTLNKLPNVIVSLLALVNLDLASPAAGTRVSLIVLPAS